MTLYKIRVYPDGIEGLVEAETSLLNALERLGVRLETLCGGAGWCGQCLVKAKGHLSEVSPVETDLISEDKLKEGYRLACQTYIKGDVDVEIPSQTRTYAHRILTTGIKTEDLRINPAVKSYNINLSPPSLDDQRSDLDRIEEAIGFKLEIPGINMLKDMPEILRENAFNIEVISYYKSLLEIRRSENRSIYGVAIDIGTTTVVVYLLDLRKGEIDVISAMNPQAKRGADVISRIDYAAKGGLEELQTSIVEEINSLIDQLCDRQGIENRDIYDVAVVGNTTMMHLFLGISPRYIAVSPYIPVFTKSLMVRASEIGIDINPNGICYILPNIAGYVGADTVGMILATGLYKEDGVRLALDIGTNGEMVLKDGDKIFSCSTAAGPAFEGANITYGMRGSRGAIDHVNIDDGHIIVHVIDDVEPVGICGSGLLDAVAVMLELGLLDETGRIIKPGGSLFESLVREKNNGLEFLLEAHNKKIPINQRDIRELQLAKGAIRSGIEILLEEAGRTYSDIETIYLAGAFGTYLDPESAIKIGLLPPVPLNKVYSVGNAAGEGAKLALIDVDFREIAEDISRKVRYIELSSRIDFQDKFMDSLYFEVVR